MNLHNLHKLEQERNSEQLATWVTPVIIKSFDDIAKQLARNRANLLRKIVLDFLQRKQNEEVVKRENETAD